MLESHFSSKILPRLYIIFLNYSVIFKKLVLEHDYDAERTFRERGQHRDLPSMEMMTVNLSLTYYSAGRFR